jgi:hypothetical protein
MTDVNRAESFISGNAIEIVIFLQKSLATRVLLESRLVGGGLRFSQIPPVSD